MADRLSEAGVTTAQILIGFGLIILLAVGSQVLASRLRIPALIVLLPAGFTVGALTSDVNPQHLLGASFQPLVSLSVAVILYDAGLSLDMRKLKGHTRKVVIRLIVLGVLITWVIAASLAAPLLGLSGWYMKWPPHDLFPLKQELHEAPSFWPVPTQPHSGD